jgi:sec-independent protein translocase protein TatA
MSIGIWQIAIVVILVVLLFGRGKISSLMGDVAKGIKSFKKGMASDVTDETETKNISENNQDSSENNQDSKENNQDSKDKE